MPFINTVGNIGNHLRKNIDENFKMSETTIENTKQQIIDFYQRYDAIYGVWGWCTLDKAGCIIDSINDICSKTDNPVCVEIGVYSGRSVIPAALELKRHGKGTIHAIDPWSNEEAVKGYDDLNAVWWGNADLGRALAIFNSAIDDTGTRDHVNIIRQTSDDAPEFESIDYLYIDGQHTIQAFRDADKYATKVKPGGFCYIDDINWGELGTKNLPKYIESLGFEFLHRVDECAIYRRVSELPLVEINSESSSQSSAWIVDNFYKDPHAVREFALKQDYHIGGIGKGYIGNRTHQQFLFPGLKERFEKIMGKKITNWKEHGMNGRFQWCVSGQPQVWHCDSQMWGGMLYLTPDAPYAYGTAMYANKKSKARTYRDPGWDISWYNEDGDPHLDGQDFEAVDVFGNVFNRLVIFDAACIHSSSGYFGTSKDNCRLWQMFFFDTED